MKRIILLLCLGAISLLAIEDISAKNITEKIKNKNVILDFYATWCPPCKVISKQLEAYNKNKRSNVVIYKIDIDKNKEVLSRFGIKSIPTLVYFKNGREVFQQVGITSEKKIAQNVNRYINN